jgi:hypothetical protein
MARFICRFSYGDACSLRALVPSNFSFDPNPFPLRHLADQSGIRCNFRTIYKMHNSTGLRGEMQRLEVFLASLSAMKDLDETDEVSHLPEPELHLPDSCLLGGLLDVSR